MFPLRFLPFVSACLGAGTMAACGSDANVLATLSDDAGSGVSSGSASGTASSGGSSSGASTGAGSGSTTGSTSGASASSGSSGVSGGGGASGTGGVSGAGDASVGSGGATAGSDGGGGSGGSADAGTDAGAAPTPVLPGNSLTGTLGTLGSAKPIVAAFTIHNGNQGRVYLSSAPLTCTQIMMAGWLSSAAAGSHVTEIVVARWEGGIAFSIGAGGQYPEMGEVNYAAGGRSSADEVMAKSGTMSSRD